MAVDIMALRLNDSPTIDVSTALASQTPLSLDPLSGVPVDARTALASQTSVSLDPLSGAPVITNEPVTHKIPPTIPQRRRDDQPRSMEVDLPAHPPPSIQPDLPPLPSHYPTQSDSPTTPRRPLRVPESLRSVIECAITEQLSLNSTQIVESTVRGVLDTCIPRLEAFFDAKVASLGSERGAKGSRTQWHSEADGWEGDDETDKDQPQNHPKGRKKPGPRGHKNFLHVRLVLKS